MSVTQEYHGDAFDRYAIVSLGMDRVKSGDDVIRLFGTAPTRTVISSVHLSSEPTSGTLMRIQGHNFGDVSAGAPIPVNDALKNGLAFSWSPVEIILDLSTGQLPQVGTIQIATPAGGASPLFSYSLPPFLRAYDWELYR